MTPIKCFLITPTDQADHFLRRYQKSTDQDKCEVCPGGYHQASVSIGRFAAVIDADGYIISPDASEYPGDKRWPEASPCGYRFRSDDEWQVRAERIYTDQAGNEFALNRPVPGMMYDAWWYRDHDKGPDGLSLIVITPDLHPWNIDGRASNCTLPHDPIHKCWVRHGTPPNLTVDKNGNTCAAGAGSIQTPKWHGFLRDGHLME